MITKAAKENYKSEGATTQTAEEGGWGGGLQRWGPMGSFDLGP